MHGIHVASALNDENSSIHGGPTTMLKQGVALSTTTKQNSVLKSGRKAFGNITNTQPQEAGTQGTIKRRVFGADLTNSTPGPRTAGKPDNAQLKAGHSVQPAQVAAVAPAVVQSWWEAEPPEKSAGKTWAQLQADREKEEDAEIESTVKQLLEGMRNITSRVLQVHATDDSDDEEVFRMRPVVCSPPQWKQMLDTAEESSVSAHGSSLPILDDNIPLEDLLPDIPMPDLEGLMLSATTQATTQDDNPVSNTQSGLEPCLSSEQKCEIMQVATDVQHQDLQTTPLQSSASCVSPERQQQSCSPSCLPKSPDSPLPW